MTSTIMPSATDQLELRNALGRFATDVAVIATRDKNGRPVGLTANSFSTVSLKPPLVAWSLAADAGSLPAFFAAPCFAINVLAEGQEELSRRFATPLPDRFAGIAWKPGIGGVPLLKGCLASFECRTTRRIEAGDHWLFLGAVERFAYSTGGVPLVFFASRYGPAATLRGARQRCRNLPD